MHVSRNAYYKSPGLISGLEVPNDDGICKDWVFVGCDFHGAVGYHITQFENCVFVECEGIDYLLNRSSTSFVSCTYHNTETCYTSFRPIKMES